MEKLLPIKFFEKRKMDEMQPEPGGGDYVPNWVREGNDLIHHAEHLAENMTVVTS